MASPRFASLDAPFLLSLENGDEICTGVIDSLSRIGLFFLATEIVIQQLADISQHSDDAKVKLLAHNTLLHLNSYNVLAASHRNVELGVAGLLADKIIEMGVLANPTKTDAVVLVEAACHGCDVLVTSRDSILKANSRNLGVALIANDLPHVVSMSPQWIDTYFKKKPQ